MEAIEAKFKDPEAALEMLLSELQEGYKVQIKRIEPDWCNGVLGTFDFDPLEPISSEWIKRKFGGRKLQIKILAPNNEYAGARTVTFPDSPRDNGADIIPGPHGSPIFASQAQPEPRQNEDTSMVKMLEKILMVQQTQAKAMQDTLLSRVDSLEKLLAEKVNQPQNNGQQQGQPPFHYDPNAQLKSTLETMKMIEELKENVTAGNPPDEENPMISKIMDKMIEKLTDDKPAQVAQGSPPLPERAEPTNTELVNLVKTRLQGMDPAERQFMVSQVLQDQEDYEEEDEIDDLPRQQESTDVDSLLSGEDQEQLVEANANTSTNAGIDSQAD